MWTSGIILWETATTWDYSMNLITGIYGLSKLRVEKRSVFQLYEFFFTPPALLLLLTVFFC